LGLITYVCNSKKTAYSKQAPNGLKFAQSGHPVPSRRKGGTRVATTVVFFHVANFSSAKFAAVMQAHVRMTKKFFFYEKSMQNSRSGGFQSLS
jgi:hypothetical protein